MATYFVENTNNVEDIEQMNKIVDKVSKVNTTAIGNIDQLTELSNKAEKFSEDIQQALPINKELKENIKIGQPLVQESTTKNTELKESLEKTKKYIDGLDGSQNIPQIRLDVTELQNGLKSNQSLAYKGSSIAAENTLEGRTEGMRIGGRTLVNLFTISRNYIAEQNKQCVCENDNKNIYTNKQYSLINLISKNIAVNTYTKKPEGFLRTINIPQNSIKTITLDENEYIYSNNGLYDGSEWNGTQEDLNLLKQSLLVLEGDWTNKKISHFFEGLKSSGENEKEIKGYKISIVSCGNNLVNFNKEFSITKGMEQESDFYECFLPKETKFSFGVISENNFLNNIDILFYDINKKYIDSWSVLCQENRFVDNPNKHTKDAYFLKIKIGSNNSVSTVIKKMGLFLGNVKIREFKKGFNKKSFFINEPLRDKDYICEENGIVKVYRYDKQYTFTGNENIGQWANSDNSCWFTIAKDSFGFNYNDTFKGSLICNNFIGYEHGYFSSTNAIKEGVEGVSANENYFTIRILKSKLITQNIEGFKAWLKNNPTTVVYQLTTPVTEIVENCVDIDLDTFGEKTYFSIENSLPGTLDFKVPSNIASIVQNTAREVNNVWDVINNLLVPSLIDINKNIAMSTIKNNLK